jgi:hypothetical protein
VPVTHDWGDADLDAYISHVLDEAPPPSGINATSLR